MTVAVKFIISHCLLSTKAFPDTSIAFPIEGALVVLNLNPYVVIVPHSLTVTS